MEHLNNMALQLAQATLEYYRVKLHCDAAGANVLRQDAAELRTAYDLMCFAQNALAYSAENLARFE